MTQRYHVLKKKVGVKGPPGVHPWGSLIDPVSGLAFRCG